MDKKLDILVGEKRNKLICLEEAPQPEGYKSKDRRFAKFLCECGKEIVADYQNWKYGRQKSCGCIRSESKVIHGYYKNYKKVMVSYKSMMSRCYYENDARYSDYGGRGIKVCDRWLSVDNFFEDMLDTYKDGLTLDRKDCNGDYCKENCQWADRSWQSYNQRMSSNNTSGKTGVYWNKRKNLWETKISVNKEQIFLGYFGNYCDAVKAREEAELKYYGRLKGN